MEFADVEIRIFKKDDGHYPVEITVDSERVYKHGKLDANLENRPGRVTEVRYADSKWGQELFNWFFADKQLANHWSEIRGANPQRRVRLRIALEEPELHQIPWEAFCEPKEGQQPILHLAAHSATPFSRYQESKAVHGTPVFKLPIRILMVAPRQDNFLQVYDDPNMASIDPDAEYQALLQAIQPLLDSQRIHLDLLEPPCNLAKIVDRLSAARAKGEGYHILHVVCHGFYDKGNVTLVLADANNQVEKVSDDTIVTVLAQQLVEVAASDEDSLRLIFLASCESAKRSAADAFLGLAPKLVSEAGVPAVVAMQDWVDLKTAQAFATKFYSQLLQHGQVDLAANEARQVIIADDLPGSAIPVLFSRLRDGSLLGRRGDMVTHDKQSFWPTLLRNIELGRCTLFIGPNLNEGLLPNREQLARRLAQECGYPLADLGNLARVAQFFAVKDKDLLRTDYLQFLSEGLLARLNAQSVPPQNIDGIAPSKVITPEAWYEKTKTVRQNEPYHLLADLPISVFVTTNVDNFMYAALLGRCKHPRQEQPSWERADSNPFRLAEEPSKDHPVVFHLNGLDSDPEHIVLSEDDYMAHLVRLVKDQLSKLPLNVIECVSLHSLVFVGYNLDDWEFRVVLQGLIRPIAQTKKNQKRHIGVQLDIHQDVSEGQIKEYLVRYLEQFQIDIYRGSALEFVRELHSRWQYYQETKTYDWWS